MKIRNKMVSIRIGNKEKTFTNLILNSYLQLFADSYLNFQDKDLDYCLVNMTQENEIDENSTTMNYDLALEAEFSNILEELSDQRIVNKYTYMNEFLGEEPRWEDFEGAQIRELGFAKRDEATGEYTLYAYLNVINYNIVVQTSQPIVVSRIDEIETDMYLYVSSDEVKAPYHLTMRGMLDYDGLEYIQTIPKLYSVGFGALPNLITTEHLIDDLEIEEGDIGEVVIKNVATDFIADSELYPKPELYPDPNMFPKKTRERFLQYKFKLYTVDYSLNDDFTDNITYTDTGLWYIQYKEITKQGNLDLKVKYERV